MKVAKRPNTPSSSTPNFWGGYKIEFKIIDRELYTKHKDNPEFLRKQAIELASDHKRIFSIDVSKYDYCEQKVEHEIDGLTIYVYSPEMMLFVNGGVKVYHLAGQKCTTHSLYSQDHPGCQVPILLR